MPIGSTRRRSGLIIPSDWEDEFRKAHGYPWSEKNRAEGKRLYELLERGKAINKLKVSVVSEKEESGAIERRHG